MAEAAVMEATMLDVRLDNVPLSAAAMDENAVMSGFSQLAEKMADLAGQVCVGSSVLLARSFDPLKVIRTRVCESSSGSSLPQTRHPSSHASCHASCIMRTL